MSSGREDTQPNRGSTGARAVERAIERRREIIDEAIAEEVPITRPERLYETCRYLLDAGGKRLRPTILLLVAESLTGAGSGTADYRAMPADGGTVDVVRAAASVEVLHTFTLIHDDIMDDDDLRRGVPAVQEAYDSPRAILAGDALHAKAFELLSDTGAPAEQSTRAVAELSNTCLRICEGQSLDLAFEEREPAGTGEYLEMVTNKTAALYAAAASLPAILLGYETAVDPLARYGRDVGQAFQIRDDLLDLTTPSDQLGKQRGSDLVEDKRTLITVHARAQEVDMDGLVEADSAAELDEDAIDAAVAELEAAGSLDYARRTARDLIADGQSRLGVLPDNDARARLEAIADYLLEREY
jgi:geranylgeranyl diphosphate synthase type I